MSFQLYERIYQYIYEYQSLIYDYYSKDSIAYLITYYNISKDTTIWDNTDLLNGSYERIGSLSGMKWNKINFLPVFFIDEISPTSFDGSDIGLIKENTTSLVIPSSYNITPYTGDIIKLDQSYLRETNNTYPLFMVKGVEISTNTDKRFWKLKIENEQSRTETELNNQLNEEYMFFEYTKKIYSSVNYNFLKILLEKSNILNNNIQLSFDKNTSLFFI